MKVIHQPSPPSLTNSQVGVSSGGAGPGVGTSSANPRGMAQLPSQQSHLARLLTEGRPGHPAQGQTAEGRGPAGDRQVRSLAASAAGLGAATGGLRSRIRNALEPFLGKTRYGEITSRSNGYLAQADRLRPGEKHTELTRLKAAIGDWQAGHPAGGTAKHQAVAQLAQAADAELARLDAATDQARDGLAGVARQALDDARAEGRSGKDAAGLIFRTDASVPVGPHLKAHVPAGYQQGVALFATSTAGEVAASEAFRHFDAQGGAQAQMNSLDGAQFAAVLDGAGRIMTQVMGGTDPDAVAAKAAALPRELVLTLQALDAEVQRAYPESDPTKASDSDARRTVFMSALFLRHVGGLVTSAAAQRSGAEGPSTTQKAADWIGGVVLQTGNMTAPKPGKVKEENAEAFHAFVADHDAPLRAFMDAVLAREPEPGHGGQATGRGVPAREADATDHATAEVFQMLDEFIDPKGKGKA